MIFQTEKQLKEFGDKLSDDKKEPIEAALTELKAAHESKDIAQIDAAMETINGAWQAASEEMQAAAQQTQDAGAGAQQDAGDSASEDDVQDVDFEEVEEVEKEK
jgi:molecular chaperone DnaK